MAKIYEYILLLIVSTVFATEIWASGGQVCRKALNTRGRFFLVTFPPFYDENHRRECTIYIASEGRGIALVSKHVNQITTQIGNYSLSKGVIDVKIDCVSIIQSFVGTQTRVLEVETTTDVAVYVAGYTLESAAAFLALPSKTLGNNYVIQTYKTWHSHKNDLIVTSVNNDTRVFVSNFNGNHTVMLSKLESYMFQTLDDPNVAAVTANKEVHLLCAKPLAWIPESGGNGDALNDMPIPVKYWGTSFIVPSLKPRSGYLIRIYTKTDSPTVDVTYSNSTSHGSVTFKGKHELLFGTLPTAILSDQPINVVQYGLTSRFGDANYGDAFMTSVPAVNHFSNNYIFPTPLPDQSYSYRVAITIRKEHLNGLLLNGGNISDWNSHLQTWALPTPFRNFTILNLELFSGHHTLYHRSPDVRFSVLLYGFKLAYGFGFFLGFSFSDQDSEHITEYICDNGGSCFGEGKCTCMLGFTGNNCENNIDECLSNPCMNDGTCVDGISSFTCACNTGYTGHNCQTDIDECLSNPCMNGGTCVDGVSIYSCACNQGYTGHNCQTDIDECLSYPCMNDGTCVDGISSYSCACNQGYTGDNCQSAVQTNDMVCFSCDYTSAPSYCDNIEYCSGDKMCFIERLTHSQGYQYYKSGCKDRKICSQESQADTQSGKSCLKCCDGSFCNSQGCGDQGLPPAGTRGPLCIDCSFVSDPKLCQKVAFCSLDEKCHIEEVEWGANFIYHLGCKSSHECAFEASTRMVSPNTMTSRSLPACAMCCDADFCNRNCTKHDTDNQQAIIG